MKVRDAMHKGVDWVGPDTSVTDLAKLMRKHDIGAIPIGENDLSLPKTISARSDGEVRLAQH